MASPDDLKKARDALVSGHPSRCLDAGWRAADTALRAGDADALREVIGIAKIVRESSQGRIAANAQQLESYCRHSLEGAGGGVESHSIIARIARMRQPRKRCPDCAEQIHAQARVCRYCGYRFEETSDSAD